MICQISRLIKFEVNGKDVIGFFTNDYDFIILFSHTFWDMSKIEEKKAHYTLFMYFFYIYLHTVFIQTIIV